MAFSLTRFESFGFLTVGTPKNLVYASPVDNEERLSHCGCLSDYPQLPRHLLTNTAVHNETCGGVR
jgi:hypothetical protein